MNFEYSVHCGNIEKPFAVTIEMLQSRIFPLAEFGRTLVATNELRSIALTEAGNVKHGDRAP